MLNTAQGDQLQQQFDAIFREIAGLDSKGNPVPNLNFKLVSAKQLLSGTLPRTYLAIQYYGAKQNPSSFSGTNAKTNSSLPMGARARLQAAPSKEKVTYHWVLWGRCLMSNTMVAVSTSNEQEKKHVKAFSRVFESFIGEALLVCSPETGTKLGDDYDHATLFVKTKRPVVPVALSKDRHSILSVLSCHPANGAVLLPMLDGPFITAMKNVKHLIMKPFDFFISPNKIEILDVALARACANDNFCDRAFPFAMICDLCGVERKTLAEGGDTLMIMLKATVVYPDGTTIDYVFTTYSYVALCQFTTTAALKHIKDSHDLHSAEMMVVLMAYREMMIAQGKQLRIIGMRAGAAPDADMEDTSDLIIPELLTGINPAKAVRFIWPNVIWENEAKKEATLYHVVPQKEERGEEIVGGDLVLQPPPLRSRPGANLPAAAAAAAADTGPRVAPAPAAAAPGDGEAP